MPVTIKADFSGLRLFKTKLQALDGLKVSVGFQGREGAQSVTFDEETGENRLNVASLATIQEFGKPRSAKSPAIPARPAMRRAAFDTGEISRLFVEAGRAYMPVKGQATKTAAAQFMRPAARGVARLMSQQYLTSRGWAKKNADATIQKKGFDFPLRETGQLERSITYRVKNRRDEVLSSGNKDA